MDTTFSNPFQADGAIQDPFLHGFFGREKALAQVRDALAAPSRLPLLIRGARQSGKSSFLQQLPGHLPASTCYVYCDLEGKAEEPLADTLFHLARAIAGAAETPQPSKAEISPGGFRSFLELVFAEMKDRRRLVLAFDEFHASPRALQDNEFLPYLYELAVGWPEIGMLFAMGPRLEQLMANKSSLFPQIPIQVTLARFSESETRDWIQAFAFAVPLEAEALRLIHHFTAGQPLCLRSFCLVLSDVVAKSDPNSRPKVTRADVADNLPAALSLCAGGLQTILDGLSTATQRLVSSALAQNLDGLGGPSFARSEIDESLRRKGITMQAADLDQALRDLQPLDIINEQYSRFQFAVPMLGIWMQQTRPFEYLELEARSSDPGAWDFYERALDLRRQGNLTAALQQVRQALEINPAFLEAQRMLGSLLAERALSGEVEETIQQLLKALEMDPEGPRMELLEALIHGVATTGVISKITSRFNKISKLNPNGIFEARAIKSIRERADFLAGRSNSRAAEAAELYALTGDHVQAARLRMRCERYEKYYAPLIVLGLLAGLATLGCIAFGDSFWIPLLLMFFSTLCIALAVHMEMSGGMKGGQMLLLAAAIGVTCVWMYAAPSNEAIFVGWAGLTIAALLHPPPTNRELLREEDKALASAKAVGAAKKKPN